MDTSFHLSTPHVSLAVVVIIIRPIQVIVHRYIVVTPQTIMVPVNYLLRHVVQIVLLIVLLVRRQRQHKINLI